MPTSPVSEAIGEPRLTVQASRPSRVLVLGRSKSGHPCRAAGRWWIAAPEISMNVLVLNCGSSSAKFAVINSKDGQELASGIAQRLGAAPASLVWKIRRNQQP